MSQVHKKRVWWNNWDQLYTINSWSRSVSWIWYSFNDLNIWEIEYIAEYWKGFIVRIRLKESIDCWSRFKWKYVQPND
jgi:hypothetical protein